MKRRVLVAEDEPALLESFCELVSDLGHECLGAHDGNQALQLALEQRPHLIVTDLMMPGCTGLELIRALRKEPALAHVPVILMSAARPSDAEKREARLFLQKPVTLERFESAITSGLADPDEDSPRSLRAGPNESVSPLSLAREAMLSWVAHEIKSPLAAALMASQLATRGVEHAEDPAILAKRLGVITRQLMRMDELVTSILDAARLQEQKLELDLEDLDITDWVTRIAEYWKDLHADYSFRVTTAEALIVRGDRERLRQILDNLISNAIKYGGPSRVVQIGVHAAGARVHISVTDTGRGISAEDLPNIFNRFHRVAGQGGRGHGLGLYIAAALARLHGGELTVESELGKGSTFTLTIPLPPGGAAEAAGPQADGRP